MPKITVVIPVYGVEKYISRCIRSLFEQTLDDIEYLFIDDCTPDRSIEILKQLLEDYPKRKSQVIIHRMEKNSGQAKVREWGIKNATGEYIIHCDSDDWVEKDMYQKLLDAAFKDGADIVRCFFDRVSDKRITPCALVPDNVYNNISLYLKKMFIGYDLSSLCDKMVRRELYNQLSVFPKENMWEDVVICTQLVKNSNRISVVPEYLYHYRMHESSIVNNPTLDGSLKRFRQSKCNVEIIEGFVAQGNEDKEMTNAMDCLKRRAKNQLLPYIRNKNVYFEWRNTFGEINYRILLNPLLSFKGRVFHFAILTRIYPFLIRTIRLWVLFWSFFSQPLSSLH